MENVSAIRVARASDEQLETVVSLLTAQLREHDIFPPEDALREVAASVLGEPRHGFILLASGGEQFVGIAYAAAHLSAEHGGTVGWLEELYVAPEWRGRGAGSALLTEVVAVTQQLGWRALELEVVAGHERAVPLYLRHGFQPVNRARYTRLL